jgi:hypothetical protein
MASGLKMSHSVQQVAEFAFYPPNERRMLPVMHDSNQSPAVEAIDPKHAAQPRRVAARALNQVDFWRGYALIAIFINHIPGIIFEQFTHRAFGLSDSAELFVFLAGFSLRYLSESKTEKLVGPRLFMRLEARAFTIYAAQILIVSLALAMMAGAALVLDTPLILQWNNAAAFFESPVPTQIGIVMLTHQMGYFDVLPLYIVLMAMAPLVVWIGRISLGLLMACSLAVWAAALYSELNLPTWPVEGVWFFNPFAWQLQFVLGFVLSRPLGLAKSIMDYRITLRVLGLIIAAGGLWLALIGWNPNPFELPEPRLFFMNDKTFLAPLRIIHMLGLVMLLVGAFNVAMHWRWFSYLARPLCLLGRNSLHVFCAGSLLSLAGQLARFAAPIGLVTDTIVLLTGVAVMLAVAWGNEWRINLTR